MSDTRKSPLGANPLAQDFDLKSLLKFAFPTILTMVFMGLYTIIDTMQLKNVFCISMRFLILISISVFGIAFVFGSPLVCIFSEKGAPVYEIARNGFLIFPFSFLFCGLNIFTSATFTALSNGRLSAILSFLRTFGLITLLLLTLPKFFGVTGVWLAVPIAELITLIVALIFLYQSKEKYF
ncbi:hypothetical protein ABXS75_07615 [Roseburia hominis]